MKISSGRVLDRLPAEEPCLGALFTSYSFDPAFFEEHVLRAVLRLTSDPVDQAERYHQEARRAIQETPIVAIVDAAERRPGRRLPFDLLEVTDVVFHPKSALLLYRERARLLIGSGNLTFSGYGGNTELFFCAELDYGDAADVGLLMAFDEHVSRVAEMARRRGTQLDLFRDELHRHLSAAQASTESAELALLDSTNGPLIEQFRALLPANATIERISMLAPFYERDDASEIDASSVFGAFISRTNSSSILEVGVGWDNPQVHASVDSHLEGGLGRIWSWAYEERGERILEHLVPIAIGPSTLNYLDNSGRTRRWRLNEVEDAIENRILWQQPTPIAYAPRNTLRSASKIFAETHLWLYPATRLVDGHPVHRPLHAKLLLVGFKAGRSCKTLIMMGSPNMSRRALLMGAGKGQGNVELALAFYLGSDIGLKDLVPDLVHVPASAFDLQERDFPEVARNWALTIDEASHDPRARTLYVQWSAQAKDLSKWTLTYDGHEIAASNDPPGCPLQVADFLLSPSSAEVVLHVDGREYPVSILVTDLIALPASPVGRSVGLDELLMLLGRRIGAERAIQIAETRAAGGAEGDALGTYFGEGFGPTDVFRAWWSAAEDLGDPVLSVSAFRFQLEGSLGIGAAWKCMVEAVAREELTPEEVWFYGAELLRSLHDVTIPLSEDHDAKTLVLVKFKTGVAQDLNALNLDVGSRPWVKRILKFYEEARI